MSGFEIAQWVLRVLLAVPIVVMGVGHFRPGPARAMASMIPPSLTRGDKGTAKRLVQFTGVCEVAGGIGLLLPPVQFAAAAALIVFMVAVFPANAYAAARPERFGKLAIPFWPRYAGQIALVLLLALTLPY